MAYDYEELSAEARWQFRAARNNSDNRITFDEEVEKAPEFQYGEHQASIAYVLYADDYYLMATESSSCFAAVCDMLRSGIGFVGFAGVACIGIGLWRTVEWES